MPTVSPVLQPRELSKSDWEKLIEERVALIFANIDDFKTVRLGDLLTQKLPGCQGWSTPLENIMAKPYRDGDVISYNAQGVYRSLYNGRRLFGFTRDKRLVYGETNFKPSAGATKVCIDSPESLPELIDRLRIGQKEFFLELGHFIEWWYKATSDRMVRIKRDYDRVKAENEIIKLAC